MQYICKLFMKLSLRTVKLIVSVVLISILSNDFSNVYKAIERKNHLSSEYSDHTGLLIVEETDNFNYDIINKREKKKTSSLAGGSTCINYLSGIVYEIEDFDFLKQNLITESDISLNPSGMEMQKHFLSLQLQI